MSARAVAGGVSTVLAATCPPATVNERDRAGGADRPTSEPTTRRRVVTQARPWARPWG